MTEGEQETTPAMPDVLAADNDAADTDFADSDTEGCLCIVASYSTAEPAMSTVTADAARRIMMAPALGDFVELRFVDIGPQPEQSGSRAAPVGLIAEGLLAPRSDPGRTYFAIVVADRSAAEAELVLTGCADNPFLAGLPIQLHGIASPAGRFPVRDTRSGTRTIVATLDDWSHLALVGELCRYADELLHHFATEQAGLSQGELRSLRARYGHIAREPGGGPSARPAAPVAPMPELPVPADHTGQPDVPAVASPEPALPQPAPPQPGPPGPPAAAARALAVAPPRSRPNRWWRRAKTTEPGGGAQSEPPSTIGLAYLLITGDDIADGQGAWPRGRAALLEVDQKIAALSQAAYLVRVLQGDADSLRGDLRRAGELSRRDVRRPVADADFAAVLEEMRVLLRRDRTRATASGMPMLRPVVVFFTPDPPFADSVAAGMFSELAQEASVIWFVPKETVELMPPAFTEPVHSHVVADQADAADTLADLLSPAASTTATDTPPGGGLFAVSPR